MIRSFHILFYLLTVCSCHKPNGQQTEANANLNGVNQYEKMDSFYLYNIAKDSNFNTSNNRDQFSRTIAIACLVGLTKRYPVNFIEEQRGLDFHAHFKKDDPLGWLQELNSGAFVTIEKDLGLIVLEKAPNLRTGLRDIRDVVPYSSEEFPEINKSFYSDLGSLVEECFIAARNEHSEVISKTKHVSIDEKN